MVFVAPKLTASVVAHLGGGCGSFGSAGFGLGAVARRTIRGGGSRALSPGPHDAADQEDRRREEHPDG